MLGEVFWGYIIIGAVTVVLVATVGADAMARSTRFSAIGWPFVVLCLPVLGTYLYVRWAYGLDERAQERPTIRPSARVVLYGLTACWAAGCAAWLGVGVSALLSMSQEAAPESDLATTVWVSLALVALTYVFRRWVDRRPASSIGTPIRGRSAVEALLGCAGGACIVAAFCGILAAGGFLSVRHASEPTWPLFAGVAAPLAVAAFYEEITFRGYLYRAFHDQWRAVGAVLVPSVVFGLLHAMNPSFTWLGLTNIVLVGVFFALTVVATDRLWFAAGAHFAWNMTMGPVLGLPVSGIEEFGRLVDTRLTGPDAITGGAFGPEGSAALTGVLVAAIAIAAVSARYYCRRRPFPTLVRPPAEA